MTESDKLWIMEKISGIPSLRSLSNLRSDGSGPVVYISEHGSQIARYKAGEEVSESTPQCFQINQTIATPPNCAEAALDGPPSRF